MARSSALFRKDQKSTNESSETIDRISELHESVLCHILSFLPIEEAVLTSILSSRWRTLWTLVLDINMDDRYLPRRSYDDYNKPRERFSDIVNNVLTLRKGLSMRKLGLYIHNNTSCDASQISDWVSTAIADNVEQMDLLFRHGETIHFPPCLFTCKSIVVLKLDGYITLHTDLSTIYLPKLKTLNLVIRRIKVDSTAASLNRFLSGCPALEDFILRVQYPPTLSICIINVPCIETIVVLKVSSIILDNFSALYFPKLRTLILNGIGFKVDIGTSLNLFFSSCCPILEDLKLCISNESNSSINVCLPRSMVVLELSGYVNIDNNLIYDLPKLKTLSLDVNDRAITGDMGSYLNWVLSRCPVLENLHLSLSHGSLINISVPWLKRLTVARCGFMAAIQVKLNAPSLEYLSISGYEQLLCFSGVNLQNLVSADILISGVASTDNEPLSHGVAKLLRDIHKTKILGLHLRRPVDVTNQDLLPEFQNLVRLSLTIVPCWHWLVNWLQKCPKLQVLTIYVYGCFDQPMWKEPTRVIPDCIASTLTEVKYGTSTCEDLNDLNLVAYFLKNANSLKKMEIDIDAALMSPSQMGNLLQNLSLLQKRYDACNCKLVVNDSLRVYS